MALLQVWICIIVVYVGIFFILDTRAKDFTSDYKIVSLH